VPQALGLRWPHHRKDARPLAHTIVQGEQFPDMTFAQMLKATSPNRFPRQSDVRPAEQ
jgi:hypothetical protein